MVATYREKPWLHKYTRPEDMWNDAVEYFEWVAENPMLTNVMTKDGPAVLEKPRAMTQAGLCLHMGCSTSLFENYAKNREDFKDVIECIKAVMYDQKYTNAAAGEMNAGLVIRDLKLSDRNEISGPEGKPIEGGFTFVGVASDIKDDDDITNKSNTPSNNEL